MSRNVFPLCRWISKNLSKTLKMTNFCSICPINVMQKFYSICKVIYRMLVVFCVCTFSCLMSSFFTDLRLALRSMEPLCLEPRSALIISSADTRTFLRAGFLNFPPKSCTFSFSSWIFYTHIHTLFVTQTFSVRVEMVYSFILTSLLFLLTLASKSYLSSSTVSIWAWSCRHSFWMCKNTHS